MSFEVGGGIHGANRLLGSSTLDIVVFGRIAGTSAAGIVGQAQDGALTLEHLVEYNAESAEVAKGRASPALIPDSTNPEVRERQLTSTTCSGRQDRNLRSLTGGGRGPRRFGQWTQATGSG